VRYTTNHHRIAILCGSCWLLLLGCASPKPGLIRFNAANDEAIVTIDDRYVGPLKRLRGGVRLPAGSHTLTIDEDGYFPQDVAVVVPAGETVTVNVELTAVPD
jgi:hypothetical protein